MKRILLIALAAGLATAAIASTPTLDPAAAQGAPPPDEFPQPSNAALVYYRAWLVADAEAWQAVRDGDAGRVSELGTAVNLLLDAAAIDHCDWGVDYDVGPWTLLPHLGKLRDTARVLKADAQRLADAGDMEGALERLEAMLQVARHTQRDRLVISTLVAAAISSFACDAIDEIVGANPITPAQAQKLLEAAKLSGDPFAARAAIRGEGVVLVGWAKKNLTDSDGGRELVKISGISGPEADRVEAMTPEQVARALDRLAPMYEVALAAFDSAEAARRLDERVKAGEFGPLAPILAPAILQIREAILKPIAQREEIIEKLTMAANR